MTVYEKSTDDPEEAQRLIRLLHAFGVVESVDINADVDIDHLLEQAAAPDGLDGFEAEQPSVDTPEEVVDLAEENDIPLVHVLRVAAERIDGMFIRTPPAHELGVEGVPETVINQEVRKALESLSDGSDSVESDYLPEPTDSPTPDEESAEDPEESREEEDYEDLPGGKRGVRKKDYHPVAHGTRKEQVVHLLEENRGEWVTGEDVAELADDLDPEDTRDRTTGSRALGNAVDNEWFDEIEVNKRSGPNLHQYRLPPEGSESGSEEVEAEEDVSPSDDSEGAEELRGRSHEESEPSYDNIPGQVSKGTRQHEVLALLTHLTNRNDYDNALPSRDLAEVGRPDASNIGATMNALEDKSLVERDGKTDTGAIRWKPTKAGEAELNRTGGFQLNAGSEESEA